MSKISEKIKVALADDHVLLRTALASLINNFTDCSVIIQVSNGNDLIEKLKTGPVPDVVLLDLNMPGMDGTETASYLQENYPDINVLMLTMYDSELALIRLLQAGVRGFLKKDVHPEELRYAIQSVMQSGFYYSHDTTGKLVNLFRKQADSLGALSKNLLTATDINFLKLASTELTYKEIARQMNLNPRSVDNLRDSLFQKLSVKSRIGLVMYAIKHGIVTF
ncbi:MAG TPA: response regulator transcription factor [Chitinophagaceae bacterium]|nr:response regulator transcription factor [Chitinophagaceae bacterium]